MSRTSNSKNGSPPVAAHWDKKTLIQEYWIPEHVKRRESPLFRKNKKFLRDECALPCWICGDAQSKENPLEVHHVFEWALWNVMNPRRVTAILEVLEFYEDGYLSLSNKKRVLQDAFAAAEKSGIVATPDDIRNLVVLCQNHHRMPGVGVHMISFPIWVGMAAIKKNAKLTKNDVARVASQLRRIDEATSDILQEMREG